MERRCFYIKNTLLAQTEFKYNAFDLSNFKDPNAGQIVGCNATAGTTVYTRKTSSAAVIQQVNTVTKINTPQGPMNFMSQFIAFAWCNLNSKFVFLLSSPPQRPHHTPSRYREFTRR